MAAWRSATAAGGGCAPRGTPVSQSAGTGRREMALWLTTGDFGGSSAPRNSQSHRTAFKHGIWRLVRDSESGSIVKLTKHAEASGIIKQKHKRLGKACLVLLPNLQQMCQTQRCRSLNPKVLLLLNITMIHWVYLWNATGTRSFFYGKCQTALSVGGKKAVWKV